TPAVTVTPADDPAHAVADAGLTTAEDTASLPFDVLANDSVVDGVASVTITGTSNGTAIVNDDDQVVFTPDADYNGPASFTYQVTASSERDTTAPPGGRGPSGPRPPARPCTIAARSRTPGGDEDAAASAGTGGARGRGADGAPAVRDAVGGGGPGAHQHVRQLHDPVGGGCLRHRHDRPGARRRHPLEDLHPRHRRGISARHHVLPRWRVLDREHRPCRADLPEAGQPVGLRRRRRRLPAGARIPLPGGADRRLRRHLVDRRQGPGLRDRRRPAGG